METISKLIEQKKHFQPEIIKLINDLLKPDSNAQINESFKDLLKYYKKANINTNLIYLIIYLFDINKEFKTELTKIFKSKITTITINSLLN